MTPPCVRKKKEDASNKQIQRINTILLLTVFATGVFYLGQINALATKGYVIKELEKQIRSTETENKKMEHTIALESSLDALKSRIDSLRLVRTSSIEYIKTAHPVAVAP